VAHDDEDETTLILDETDAEIEPDAETEPEVTEGSDGLLSYEVSEWSGESRRMLDSMLTSADVRHFWQGTTLSVASENEAETDAIIEEVLATATMALDEDRDKAVYEVAEWSAAMQTSLAESLTVAEVPYEWDEQGDLVVYADDEETVDDILEAMPDPDDAERMSETVDVQATLTRAWRAASELAKSAENSGAVVDLAESAETLSIIKLPFGFEAAPWRHIVDQAMALQHGLAEDVDDAEPWSDEQVEEAAATLRDTIRPYL